MNLQSSVPTHLAMHHLCTTQTAVTDPDQASLVPHSLPSRGRPDFFNSPIAVPSLRQSRSMVVLRLVRPQACRDPGALNDLVDDLQKRLAVLHFKRVTAQFSTQSCCFVELALL